MPKSNKTNAISVYVRFIMRCTIAEQRVKNKVSDASRMKKSYVLRNESSFMGNYDTISSHSREGGNPGFMGQCYLYILASKKNGTLYVGVTNDLIRRVYEHKQDIIDGFTRKYGVHNLVCYEIFNDIYDAIAREKQIKKWNRTWKIRLIEETNPEWKDLYQDII